MKSFFKVKVGRDMFYDTLLFGYIIFLGFVCHCFYLYGDSYLSVTLVSSDPERFLYIFETSNVESFIQINFKNILYTCLTFVFGKTYMSMLWTSFCLYVICLVLLYKLVNLNKSSHFYGFFAVLVVNSITPMIFYVYGLNVHISETVFILLLVYLFEKSNYFSYKNYSVLYVACALLSFLERESIIMYLGFLIIVTSFFSLKNKKYDFLFYNGIILAVLAFIVLSGTNSHYLSSKVGHFNMFADMGALEIKNFLSQVFFKCQNQIRIYVTPFYVWVFVFCALMSFFFKYKHKADLAKITDWFIVFLLCVYFVTVIPAGWVEGVEGPVIYDLLPLFFLLAISMANYLYIYRKQIIYILGAMVLCFFINPFNPFDYKIDYYELGSAYVSENIYNSPVGYSVGRQLPFLVRELGDENIVFVIGKLKRKNDFNALDPSLIEYAASANKKAGLILQETFMLFLADMLTLESFLHTDTWPNIMMYVTHRINIPKENICRVLFFYRKKSSLAENTFRKLKTFRIDVNDMFYFEAHMYAIAYNSK